MPCKKSDMISAINSYAAATKAEDRTLINFAASLVSQLVETLEFSPEEEEEQEEKKSKGFG